MQFTVFLCISRTGVKKQQDLSSQFRKHQFNTFHEMCTAVRNVDEQKA